MDRLAAMDVFVRVVDEGSFAGAGRSLQLSAPTVTRAVASLEDHLGTQLLTRTTRSVALTEPGRRYLEDCRRILAEVDAAEAVATGSLLRPKGTLHVTAPVMFGERHVLPVLGAFLEVGVPGIHVTRIIDLAEEYGLEIAPRVVPEVGTGDVFQKRQPNRWVAGIVLALILLSLFVTARAPWGMRMLRTTIAPESIVPPPAPRPPSGLGPRPDASDGNGTATDPPPH